MAKTGARYTLELKQEAVRLVKGGRAWLPKTVAMQTV
jgi:hypothetical protein